MKKKEIFGEKINEEKKIETLNYLKNFSEEFTKKLKEVEIKKTNEDALLVRSINGIINKELKSFDLPERKINDEKIFFLLEDIFLDLFPPKKQTLGTSMPESEMIFIKKPLVDKIDSGGKLLLSFILLHEMLHFFSHHKFYLKNNSEETILNYRSGFVTKDLRSEPAKVYLRGFNEGVLQNFCIGIINSNKDFFEKNIAGGNADYFQKIYDFWSKLYEKNGLLADVIILEVAKYRKQKEELIRNEFYKSLFTGEIMKLRDVERIFGKKTLKVLAKFGRDDDMNDKIINYFLSGDSEKRRKIAEDLLA